MALVTGPEAAINAVLQVLTTYLQTQLDADWAAAADALPKPYDGGGDPIEFRAFKYELEPYSPTVHVYGYRGQQIASGAPVWGQFTHYVAASFLVKGDDAQTIDQQATRFGWGIARTIETHQGSLADYISGAAGAQLLTYEMGEPNAELQQVGYLIFGVNVIETY